MLPLAVGRSVHGRMDGRGPDGGVSRPGGGLGCAGARGRNRHRPLALAPADRFELSLRLDGLSLLFAGLILGIGLLIILYARFYLAAKTRWAALLAPALLFQGAMLGIVLSDNVLLLVVFWELTSLSSFLLIGYWNHLPEARQGARMALR